MLKKDLVYIVNNILFSLFVFNNWKFVKYVVLYNYVTVNKMAFYAILSIWHENLTKIRSKVTTFRRYFTMKKLFSLLLAGAMVFSLAACGQQGGAASDEQYEIALITDLGSIDDKSFNQGCWEGVVEYATANDKTHKYYQPTEKSVDAYLASIDLAVQGGAKVVVTPGFLFEEPIYKAQEQYPDVTFILVDGTPNDGNQDMDARVYKTGDNAVGVLYAEEESGFLAGYAAVKEGYRDLGFIGGLAVPAVIRFGYGYIQGAEFAANELGLDDGAIKMKYNYCGAFNPAPEFQTLASSWYNDGVETIFACAGGVGNSVMAAAEGTEGKTVIGVDVDQYAESDTVITSATKGLKASVNDLITKYYAGEFPGGQNLVLTAQDDGVALPMENSRFENFTKEDYDAIFARLVANEDGILDSLVKDDDVEDATQIETTKVDVTLI